MINMPFKRLALLATLTLMSQLAYAATNIGRGNWGADPQSPDNDNIADSAVVTINSVAIQVIKKAFVDDNTGTEILNNSTVAAGTIVKFLIYVDNSAGTAVNDVRLEDLLNDTDFTYQVGSLKWNNLTTASGAATATIFTDSNGGAALSLTDAIDGLDVASVNTTLSPNDRITFGAHSLQGNATLNIPANTIAAFLFRARVN